MKEREKAFVGAKNRQFFPPERRVVLAEEELLSLCGPYSLQEEASLALKLSNAFIEEETGDPLFPQKVVRDVKEALDASCVVIPGEVFERYSDDPVAGRLNLELQVGLIVRSSRARVTMDADLFHFIAASFDEIRDGVQ